MQPLDPIDVDEYQRGVNARKRGELCEDGTHAYRSEDFTRGYSCECQREQMMIDAGIINQAIGGDVNE